MGKFIKAGAIFLLISALLFASGCTATQQNPQGGGTTPPGQQPSNNQPTAPADSGTGSIPQPPAAALPD